MVDDRCIVRVYLRVAWRIFALWNGRAVFLVNGLSFRGTRSIGRKIEAEFGTGGVIKNGLKKSFGQSIEFCASLCYFGGMKCCKSNFRLGNFRLEEEVRIFEKIWIFGITDEYMQIERKSRNWKSVSKFESKFVKMINIFRRISLQIVYLWLFLTDSLQLAMSHVYV